MDQALEKHDRCLIIDGHSFPSKALPYELNSEAARPDFCLGTDDFHTAEKLVEGSNLSCSASAIQQRNEPFSGTIVPLKHYRKDQRVQSLMIEINRKLYVKEDYSVDRASLQKVVVALDSVREKLAENDFFILAYTSQESGPNRIDIRST